MFTERFAAKLLSKKKEGLYRKPVNVGKRRGKYIYINNRKVVNFASNDYLGLGVDREISEKVSQNFLKYRNSSSSSRLVSGNFSIITEAEKEYANYFGFCDALFFPSGYQANLALFSGLFSSKDSLFFDKHVHASCVKGMVLSNADCFGYNHNSISHLEKRLIDKRSEYTAVVTESLFSMDGDFIKKEEYTALRAKYGFLSVIDAAHSLGAVGEKGCGQIDEIADVGVGTFGKAFGFFGAFLLLPAKFKEYLFNFASPLIYSTALPEAHAVSVMDILQIISKADEKRCILKDLSVRMKHGLNDFGFKVKGDAHIISIIMGNSAKALKTSQDLIEKGYFVLSARYPTVPFNKAVLRIGMTALHTKEDVDGFINALSDLR